MPFILKSLWLFSLYLTELLWHHDLLQHNLVFADLLLLSDLTVHFRTTCFYFSSRKQYNVMCNVSSNLWNLCSLLCYAPRKKMVPPLQLYQLVCKGNKHCECIAPWTRKGKHKIEWLFSSVCCACDVNLVLEV